MSPRKSRKKILVFFKHGDVDARAGQQVTEHHAGGAAADDATRRFKYLVRHGCFYLPGV